MMKDAQMPTIQTALDKLLEGNIVAALNICTFILEYQSEEKWDPAIFFRACAVRETCWAEDTLTVAFLLQRQNFSEPFETILDS